MKTEKNSSLTAKLIITLCVVCLLLVLFADTFKDVDLSENVIGVVVWMFLSGSLILIGYEGWSTQNENPRKVHLLSFRLVLAIASIGVATFLHMYESLHSWYRLSVSILSIFGSLTIASTLGAILHTLKKRISENQLPHRTQ